MGTFQEAHLDITIPAAAVPSIAGAILARDEWSDPSFQAQVERDTGRAIVEFIVCVEGGVLSDVDYDVDPKTGDIWINAHTDGKLGFDSKGIEELYAANGATGTIDGVCEGDKFRVRLADGKAVVTDGETFYAADKGDSASVAVDATLKFIRGQISEREVLTVLSQARAAGSAGR